MKGILFLLFLFIHVGVNGQDIEELLIKMSKRINAQTPIQIDEFSTLQHVVFTGKVMNFKYTVYDSIIPHIDKDQYKAVLLDNLVSVQAEIFLQSIVKNQIYLKSVIYDHDNKLRFTINISPDDLAKKLAQNAPADNSLGYHVLRFIESILTNKTLMADAKRDVLTFKYFEQLEYNSRLCRSNFNGINAYAYANANLNITLVLSEKVGSTYVSKFHILMNPGDFCTSILNELHKSYTYSDSKYKRNRIFCEFIEKNGLNCLTFGILEK